MASAPSDWSPPPHRRGLAGVTDWLVGPGATPAEVAVVFAPATAAAVAVATAGLMHYGWSHGQAAFGGVLAFDVIGGAVANATTAAKRWFHRRGTTAATRYMFVAVHGAHVAAVAAVWRGDGGFPPAHVVGVYAALLAGAAAVVGVSRRLQRPVAVAAVAAATLAAATSDDGLVRLPRGMGWFVPTLALKLLVGHLVTEEPYVGEPSVVEGAGGKDS